MQEGTRLVLEDTALFTHFVSGVGRRIQQMELVRPQVFSGMAFVFQLPPRKFMRGLFYVHVVFQLSPIAQEWTQCVLRVVRIESRSFLKVVSNLLRVFELPGLRVVLDVASCLSKSYR